MIGNPNDETNSPHKLLLTNTQVANLRKAFSNKSSTDIKLSKTQLSKMIQSKGFFCRLLVPFLITGLPLIKNVIKPLAKSVLFLLRSAAEIHKKILRPGTTTLIMSHEELEDIMKIVKSLEDFGLLLKGVSETIQNEAKEPKRGFFSTLLGTLGANLLGSMLASRGMNRAGEGIIRAAYGSSIKKEDF